MADELIAGNTSSTGDATAAAAPSAAPATPDAAPAAQAGTQQPATEGQTTDAKAPETTEGDQAKPQGAPEKYEFKAPEGSTLDSNVIDKFSEVAKELNLPQDAAQKVIDKVAPVLAQRQAEAIKQVQTEWVEATKTDKEFGGDKLDANLSIAKKGLEAFGTPELRTLLNETGLGNNPEIIRAFYRAGKSISQDRVVTAGSGSAPQRGQPALYAETI